MCGDGAQDDSDTNIYCDIMPVRTTETTSTVIDDCDIKKTNDEENHQQCCEGRNIFFLLLKISYKNKESIAI